jgi:nucleoside-diphosphate-sugar epimerase
MSKTALILGASGKIGRHSREAFAAAGWNVRTYDRTREDMVEAARGASVIVNGLNPPNYHDWARQIPAITAQVIAAAQASGATVILPGNVYNLDRVGGRWSEHTAHAPTTRKGRIREEMEQAYRAAQVRTIVLRAGNFIDPERNGDVMSVLLLREFDKGRILAAGDPDATQAYCYVPDWAAAAVALAEIRTKLETFEDIPFPGHAFSVNELQRELSALSGLVLTVRQFPWWAMTLTAPFWELAREMREMRYLYSLSHTLDGTKLARLVPGFRPTPLTDVLRAVLQAPRSPGSSHRALRGGPVASPA